MARDLGQVTAQKIEKSQGRDLGIDQSSATLAHSQQVIDQLRAKEAAAQQASQVANAPATIAKETVKGTAGGIFDPFIKGARSGIQAIGEAFGAKPTTEQYTGLAGTPQQTLQADVAQGKTSVPGALGEFALDAASVLPIGKGATLAKDATESTLAPVVKGPLSKLTDFLTTRSAKKADEQATKTAVQALTPKMSAKEIADAVASGKGTVKGGKASVDMTKDKSFMDMVGHTKSIVKGKSPIEDTNAVRNALSTEADSLKSQIQSVDHPYTFRELASKMSGVETPISIKGTVFEKQIGAVKDAAIQIAKDSGGNVSGLLDARKSFDALVQKEYPTLYDSANAPMRNAITGIRNAMNDFIEENLPANTGFKESLAKQRQFYKAIDNLASNAPQEIKDTSTFAKRNPKTTKVLGAAALGAAGAAGAGGVYEGGKKILGE